MPSLQEINKKIQENRDAITLLEQEVNEKMQPYRDEITLLKKERNRISFFEYFNISKKAKKNEKF